MTDLDLDANFFYNSMLAKALIQVASGAERKLLQRWIEKLFTLDNNLQEKKMRNDYMWFIMLMLQCHKIRDPFLKPPPKNLVPLRDAVAQKYYEDILVANEQNMSWINTSGRELHGEDLKAGETRSSNPAKFFRNQPVPPEGLICYIAAFSDHDLY